MARNLMSCGAPSPEPDAHPQIEAPAREPARSDDPIL